MLGQKGARWKLFHGFLWLLFIIPVNRTLAEDPGSGGSTESAGAVKSYQRTDALLACFTEEKRQEFIGRQWISQDSALRFAREEGVRVASILSMMIAGRLAINAIAPRVANAPLVGQFGLDRAVVPTITIGLQSLMDYFSSSSNEDFYLRSGTNALNGILPGNGRSFWRKGLTFSLGHLALAYSHWPEIRMQLQSQHGGIRRIRFMSLVLDQAIDLELIAPRNTSGESAQLVMHFDASALLFSEQNTGLTLHWLALADTCRNYSVSSVRIRPVSGKMGGVFVQLWRDDEMLSETNLTLTSDSSGSSIWLTDWLVRKTWPEGQEINIEPVANPLTASVLSAIRTLVAEGDEASITVHDLPNAVSPEGRLAMFSTGSDGYLLVDRNKTSDVALPELWLNTEQSFDSEMNVTLARLEEQQEPGHWRGVYGLVAELAKSYISRELIYTGLNWFRDAPQAGLNAQLPKGMYGGVKKVAGAEKRI